VIDPPDTGLALDIVSGPERRRSELSWQVRLGDGRPAVLSQLVHELADEPALRRRYVYEAERLRDLGAPRLAPVLAIGPAPDPRAPDAPAPWRLRATPQGERLDRWVARRAPAPADEVVALVAAVADAVAGVHERGAVLRDLEPAALVWTPDTGDVWLTDVGLARLDVLSSRTASSLMVELSPYAAPEQLLRTAVDARADVFSLGVLLWHALTGVMPYGDGETLLREHRDLPPLESVCHASPPGLDELLRRCLAEKPEHRLANAAELRDALRGEAELTELALERVACQACGEPLRPGLRLCLHCGKQAVQFGRVPSHREGSYSLVLERATEKAEFSEALLELFETVHDGDLPELRFVVGDARMYSKREREQYRSVPARLFSDLDEPSATALARRATEAGLKVKVRANPRRFASRKPVRLAFGAGFAGLFAVPALVVTGASGALIAGAAVATVGSFIAGGVAYARHKFLKREPVGRLREAPAALPAADPLVARLADALAGAASPDVREQVGELAVLVQRLAEHGAQQGAAEATRDDAAIPRLVEHVANAVEAIGVIDGALADVDEGALVRAIARSEARGQAVTARGELLAGLDRLRALEDERAEHLQRLLEAGRLLRRVVDLRLSADADAKMENAHLQLALAAVGADFADNDDQNGE